MKASEGDSLVLCVCVHLVNTAVMLSHGANIDRYMPCKFVKNSTVVIPVSTMPSNHFNKVDLLSSLNVEGQFRQKGNILRLRENTTGSDSGEITVAYQGEPFITIKGLQRFECVCANYGDNRFNVIKSVDCSVLVIHN